MYHITYDCIKMGKVIDVGICTIQTDKAISFSRAEAIIKVLEPAYDIEIDEIEIDDQ